MSKNQWAIALGVAAALGLAAPGAARADWRRAETAHFVVYSNGSERNLRDYATRLERFDGLLRTITGGRPAADGLRKLPVYLVADGAELRTIQPDLPEGIDGYYRAGPRDIRAILIRGRDDDLLLHEYTHHFMSHHSPGSYPGWFREGFAEYFATATVDGRGKATFGYPGQGRLYTLDQDRWMPLDRLLTASPMDLETEAQRRVFYAQAWLLTHYLLSDADRYRRLDAYLGDLRSGADPVEAFPRQLGVSLEALTGELRSYLRRGLRYAELNVEAVSPEITVTALPASADDLLLSGLDLVDGVDEARSGEVLSRVRAAAARHPGDPLALTVLARAEIDFGDATAGDAALEQVLAVESDNVEALLLAADRRVAAAHDSTDEAGLITGYREAQALLGRAYAADPTDYRVLGQLAFIRQAAPDYPTANDLDTWRLAVEHAPQVLGLRAQAAEAMLRAGFDDEAEYYLLPIATDPHAGGFADQARARIDAIRARRANRPGDVSDQEPS